MRSTRRYVYQVRRYVYQVKKKKRMRSTRRHVYQRTFKFQHRGPYPARPNRMIHLNRAQRREISKIGITYPRKQTEGGQVDVSYRAIFFWHKPFRMELKEQV